MNVADEFVALLPRLTDEELRRAQESLDLVGNNLGDMHLLTQEIAGFLALVRERITAAE